MLMPKNGCKNTVQVGTRFFQLNRLRFPRSVTGLTTVSWKICSSVGCHRGEVLPWRNLICRTSSRVMDELLLGAMHHVEVHPRVEGPTLIGVVLLQIRKLWRIVDEALERPNCAFLGREF